LNFSLTSEHPFDEVADYNSSLRILMVSARYSPYVGGTETHVHEVAKRMKDAGHDVTVLTTDPSKKLAQHDERDGVTVRRVKAYPADKDYYLAPALYPIIARGHWDIVHLQGYHTLVAPLTMLASMRSKTPFVVSFHSGGHSSSVRTNARGLQRFLLRPLLTQASCLICVSQFEADFFRQNLGIASNCFAVIPNGSQLPQLTTPIQKTDETLIVSPGRLERYKGHQHAIEAFPKVLAQKPNTRLRVVGTGPYESELRQLAQASGVGDRIEIGSIPAEDREGMAALLSRASLVVLFSEYEAHPVAVMEALSLGASVLVTDTSGLGEIARKGWANAIPLDSSPEATAQAMLQQLDNPLYPSAVSLPTWDDCAASLLNTYRAIRKQKLPT
jgi:glycogen synthase